MSKIFFTSDTHFFHKNIIDYSNRPWNTIEQMNEGIIDNWNNVVGEKDIVYHLGDVAMGGSKRAEELSSILFKLNGTIRLVRGNHDDYVLNSPCIERFDWVKDYHELKYTSPSYGKRKFVLMHYPLLTWNSSNRKTKEGLPYSIQLHGHCHGGVNSLNNQTTRMDVGVDPNEYQPLSIESIIKLMNCRVYDPIDHHK